jgi:histidine ammonia-lyase
MDSTASTVGVVAREAMAIITYKAKVLALETVCACKAIDLRSPPRPSELIGVLRDAIRQAVPFVDHDQVLRAEVAVVAAAILSCELADSERKSLGRPLD